MLLNQFLSYVTEVAGQIDLFVGCDCCFLDEHKIVLTGYGLLGMAVETAVDDFDSEMASENPRCYHFAGTADILKGQFDSYLRDGGSLSEVHRRLVKETRLVQLLSHICLSDALNNHGSKSGCYSCCCKFQRLIETLHSIFVSYWGARMIAGTVIGLQGLI